MKNANRIGVNIEEVKYIPASTITAPVRMRSGLIIEGWLMV
jgi:hypothetical protein